jgi:hypothetical protein
MHRFLARVGGPAILGAGAALALHRHRSAHRRGERGKHTLDGDRPVPWQRCALADDGLLLHCQTAGIDVDAPPPRVISTAAGRIRIAVRRLLRAMEALARLSVPLALHGPWAWATGRHESFWRALSSALASLGGGFVKLAQWASSRPDIFPPEAIEHLIVLTVAWRMVLFYFLFLIL